MDRRADQLVVMAVVTAAAVVPAAIVAVVKAGPGESRDEPRTPVAARSLPGVSRSAPDRFGSVRYTAGAPIGVLHGLLRASGEGAAGRALRAVPPGTGITLDMWADADDRPTWIGLGTTAPGARFTGSMAFRSYR